MSRRQKSRKLQHSRRLEISHAAFNVSVQEGSSSVNTNRPQGQWERRGEGFQLLDREQACVGSEDGNGASHGSKTDVKSRTQFGRKWIQPEDLLQTPGCSNAQNQRSGSHVFGSNAALKLSDITSSPSATAEDTDHDAICWNNSDSDCEDVRRQETLLPPAKKLRTSFSARKTKQRRKSVKSQNAPVPLNPGPIGNDGSESEDLIALSASESEEEEEPMFKEEGKSHQLSGSESPVHQIECIGSPGSPDHSPSTPDQSSQFAITDLEEDAVEVDDCLAKKRPVLLQRLGSPLKDAGGEAGTPSISSCASSQRTTGDSDVSPGQSGLRASEWARQVKWETTPTKQPSVAPPHQGDSGKKRKKFTKGGLAEQMSKILQREKSARRMWQHQHKASVGSEGPRGMLVKVSSVWTVYGLQLAKCTIVRSHSHGSSLQPSPNPQCFVLFSPLSSKHKAGLQCGATVRISPPWQQMDTGAGRTVLCTRYHVDRHATTRSQSQPSSPSLVSEVTEGNDAADVTLSSSPVMSRGRWLCPCSADPSLPAARCPAHLFPFLSSSIAPHNPATQSSEQSSTGKLALHTVTCKERAPRRTLTFHSMLESIEKAPAGNRLLPAFQATVLRVFREREESISYRPWLLVEDSQGTVAVITGTEDTPLTHLEGRLCCLTCLRVHSRTNADRDPALFSAVCGAWAQRSRPSASHDSDPQVTPTNHSPPPCQEVRPSPGFCYLLEVDREAWDLVGEGEDWLTLSTDHPLTPPPPLLLTSLAHALQNQNEGSRVSVLGRFLYFREKQRAQERSQQHSGGHSSSQNTSLLYITDHSVQKGRNDVHHFSANQGKEESSPSTQDPQSDGRCVTYLGVEVRQDCVVSSMGWDGGRFRGRQPFLVLLRDVWLVNGTWIADKYSTLVSSEMEGGEAATLRARIDPDVYSAVSQCSVALPAVCLSSPTHSLISVSGTVVSVDDKSAFSWEECDGCGSDQLATRTGSQTLTCLTCRKQVTSAVPRMKMDVAVRSHTDPSVTISVSLQQSTIEELLPDEVEEEGYEVECVLHKAVGPLNCVLISRTDPGHTFTAVQLLC